MNLPQRVKNIILKPRSEWETISHENRTLRQMALRYVFPLAGLAAFAAMLGWTFVGVDNVFVKLGGIRWGLYELVEKFLVFTLTILIATFAIDFLAPFFKSQKNINKSAELVSYSCTPGLVGALLTIIPSIGFVGYLFGLYGFYLWWLGLEPMKQTPDDKQIPYLIVSIVLVIVVFAVLANLLAWGLQPVFGVDPLPDLKLH